MSTETKVLHAMRCDHPGGCPSELEADDGAWLYASEDEARKAAFDYDWVTDGRGKDYCDHHRDDLEPEARS